MATRRTEGKDSPGNGPTRKFRGGGGSTGVADWAGVSGDLIRDAIAAAAICDGALRFGVSSDGGAYSIGIYGDGKPYTTWVSCNEDVDDTLRELIEYLATLADQRSAETAQKAKK